MNGAEETLEDLVIRALSHKESKNILKIVASYPEGSGPYLLHSTAEYVPACP